MEANGKPSHQALSEEELLGEVFGETDWELMMHICGERQARRLLIAFMYWRMNRSARQIAEHLHLRVGTVKNSLTRILRRPVP